ncbi:hypothetical protein MYX77_02945 [Acidobacteriia bacterium AH_259_A11_L15]|nr:hypothetical protein [Acidobacteriia bacterium AH_259_A11_L15]
MNLKLLRSAKWVRVGVITFLLLVSLGCATTRSSENVQGAHLTPPPPCPVTIPNETEPPVKYYGGMRTYSPEYQGPRSDRMEGSHGNGRLWVILPPDGKLRLERTAGGLAWVKVLWWRAVRGVLSVEGRRLDACAGPLRFTVPAVYGQTGLQVGSIEFPTEGCWEVTGRAGEAELTFVVDVQAQKGTGR